MKNRTLKNQRVRHPEKPQTLSRTRGTDAFHTGAALCKSPRIRIYQMNIKANCICREVVAVDVV